MWFSFLFLVVAVWGLTCLVIALFNPKDLAAKLYRADSSVNRIGPLKLGIFFLSEDPKVHRAFVGALGAFLAVGGTVLFVSLV